VESGDQAIDRTDMAWGVSVAVSELLSRSKRKTRPFSEDMATLRPSGLCRDCVS
jgi:hypothetical protein